MGNFLNIDLKWIFDYFEGLEREMETLCVGLTGRPGVIHGLCACTAMHYCVRQAWEASSRSYKV